MLILGGIFRDEVMISDAINEVVRIFLVLLGIRSYVCGE